MPAQKTDMGKIARLMEAITADIEKSFDELSGTDIVFALEALKFYYLKGFYDRMRELEPNEQPGPASK